MRKGNYGSVLIHIRDGIITGIVDKNDFNCDAFVNHVESTVSRVVVKSYKVKKKEIIDNKLTEVSENDQNLIKSSENSEKIDNSVIEEKEDHT